MTLHGAVQHLVSASHHARQAGLQAETRTVDTAVVEIGRALYGSHVHSVADARHHIRAALRLLRNVKSTQAVLARTDLRAALRAMGKA